MDDQPANNDALHMGRRSESRLRVRLPARLTTLARTHNVILRDLSLSGAKVLMAEPVAPGKEVVLEWDKYEAFGVVTWNRSQFCGLLFLEPILPRVLIATRDLQDLNPVANEADLSRRAARDWAEGKTER